MSMHKKPLTPLERAGLEAHGLDIGTPSQLSDVFRQGVAFAIAANAPGEPEGEKSVVVIRCTDGIKSISFPNEEWSALDEGDVIYAREKTERVDFDDGYVLPKYDEAPDYGSTPLKITFDGAEGGAVWLYDPNADQLTAVRGPEACRELARLLLAWADAHEG